MPPRSKEIARRASLMLRARCASAGTVPASRPARGPPLACVVGGGDPDDIEELVRRHAILHEVIAGLPGP